MAESRPKFRQVRLLHSPSFSLGRSRARSLANQLHFSHPLFKLVDTARVVIAMATRVYMCMFVQIPLLAKQLLVDEAFCYHVKRRALLVAS